MLDLKKPILRKLNKVLYQLNTIENKLEILQGKEQYLNQQRTTQKNNIRFPISIFP